jgi:hypothetical protein
MLGLCIRFGVVKLIRLSSLLLAVVRLVVAETGLTANTAVGEAVVVSLLELSATLLVER